jgi:hypothetical protein
VGKLQRLIAANQLHVQLSLIGASMIPEERESLAVRRQRWSPGFAGKRCQGPNTHCGDVVSDGTEILNSGTRPPATGDFCLGAWKKLGNRTYKLNHFTVPLDPSGTQPAGTGNIHEIVEVSPNGDHFTGSFTIDQYDLSGNIQPQDHVVGVIKADRLDADSPPSPLL